MHNLAAALYTLEAEERRLLEYLQRAKLPGGACLYDPKYVLRLARERKRSRACVQLLCELKLWEDAVALALAAGGGAQLGTGWGCVLML